MRTQEARQIPIPDYLERIGAKKAREQRGTNGLEWVYHSPVRRDVTPSLCVNILKNVWSDVPDDPNRGGGLIELVNYINGHSPLSDAPPALQVLDLLYGHSLFVAPARTEHPPLSGTKPSESIVIDRVQPLYRRGIKHYLHEIRKISPEVANKHFVEVHYHFPKKGGKPFFAAGFPSGKTYAIRNPDFKGFAGTGADISIYDQQSPKVAIFEGAMDFATWLSAKRCIPPPHSALILNTTSFTKRAIEWIRQHECIETLEVFRDRDELHNKQAGGRAYEELVSAFPDLSVIDMSQHYPNHKDLNAWWVDRLR